MRRTPGVPAGSLDVAMYAAPIVIDPIAAAAAASQFAVTLDAIAADVVDWWGPGPRESGANTRIVELCGS